MNKTRLLWMLVAADVLLAFASVGAEAFFGWTLPPTLAEYNRARFTGFSIANPADAFHLFLLSITTLCAFAAWISLVNFWRFARQLYLVSCGIWIVTMLFSGPRVETSIGTVFSVMNAMVGGVIIGLVYFSDLARRFERAPVESMANASSLGTGRA
jgi:hypothetical protein